MLSPLECWTAIHNVLKLRLGDERWNIWIRHARLLKYEPGAIEDCRGTLVVALPAGSNAVIGAMQDIKEAQGQARKLNLDIRFEMRVVLPADHAANPFTQEEFLEPTPSELWEAKGTIAP